MPVTVTVDNLTTSDRTPIITGTCDTDNTDIVLTVDGTDIYTTKSLSNVWRCPTTPHVVSQGIIAAGSGVADDDRYAAWPHFVRLADDRILCIYSRGPSHIGNGGRIVGKFSDDEGLTWGSEVTIADDPSGNETRNTGVTVDPSSGRISVFYSEYNASTTTRIDIKVQTSTDNGSTWSAATSIASEFPTSPVVPFYIGCNTVNGLMQTFYYHSEMYVLFSTDGGVTWGNRVTVYSGLPANDQGEGAVVAIDASRLVILLRSNNDPKTFIYIKSSDGGLTWSALSSEIAWTTEGVTVGAPICAIKVEDDVIVAWGGRRPVSALIVNRVNAEAFFTDPSIAWSATADNRVEIYNSNISAPGEDLDFGYPTLIELPNSPYTALCGWYDMPSGGGGDDADIRAMTIPRL